MVLIGLLMNLLLSWLLINMMQDVIISVCRRLEIEMWELEEVQKYIVQELLR